MVSEAKIWCLQAAHSISEKDADSRKRESFVSTILWSKICSCAQTVN